MRRKIISLAVFISFAVVLCSFAIGDLPIGSGLPKGDIAMKNINGQFISMKGASRQNGLLVMFTCNTCPFVIRNQERSRAICKYALENNIGVILLNSNESQRGDDDSFEAMQQYAKQQHYDWYYAIDKDNILADEFGAKRTPECFLFNKDLKLTYHGAIDDNPGDAGKVIRQYLKEAITGSLSGKEISVKESRSVGCAIKRKET